MQLIIQFLSLDRYDECSHLLRLIRRLYGFDDSVDDDAINMDIESRWTLLDQLIHTMQHFMLKNRRSDVSGATKLGRKIRKIVVVKFFLSAAIAPKLLNVFAHFAVLRIVYFIIMEYDSHKKPDDMPILHICVDWIQSLSVIEYDERTLEKYSAMINKIREHYCLIMGWMKDSSFAGSFAPEVYPNLYKWLQGNRFK